MQSKQSSFRTERRSLLKGLGSVGVLLSPLVRAAYAQAAAASSPNFLYFHTPNGHVLQNFTWASRLKPLSAHKADSVLLSGLKCAGESTKHSHEDIVRILTCVSGSKDALYDGQGPSIDAKLATKSGTQPLTVGVRVQAEPNWQTKLSWAKSGSFNPHIIDHAKILAEVFKNFVPAGMAQTPGVIPDRLKQKRSVMLDWIEGDIKATEGRLPAGDVRQHFDRYITSIREVETGFTTRISAIENMTGTDMGCSASSKTDLQTKVSAGISGGNAAAQLKSSGDLVLDIVTTGMQCGLRPVATVLYQPASAGVNPIGKSSGDHHQVSHYENGGTVEEWSQIDGWYAERFADLVTMAKAKGILDRTIIAWGSEISEEHDLSDMSWVVSGGKSLKLRLGQDFDGAGKVDLSNLWVSVQNAFGITETKFGDGSTGGISGLFQG